MRHFLTVLSLMLFSFTSMTFAQKSDGKLYLQASKSLMPSNSKVTFEVVGENPSTSYKYKWTLPKQVKKLSERGNKVVLKIENEGVYMVKVAVSSDDENDDVVLTSHVEVSNTKRMELLSVGKKIVSCTGNVGSEKPDWLLDGTANPDNYSKKWCAENRREHEVVIDLGASCELYRMRLYDCRTKEPDYENVQNFKLLVSEDGKDWKQVVDETGNNDNIKNVSFEPVKGRYVKFIAYDPHKNFTIRLWELELYGVKGA